MKYIILFGSEWHMDFDNEAEAREYYNELVAEDGKYFDLTLCEVMESHEQPEEYIDMDDPLRGGAHYGINGSTQYFDVKDIDAKKVEIKPSPWNKIFKRWR